MLCHRFTKISLLLLAIIASVAVRPAGAQVRGFGAGALVLDDNHGHTLIVQTPQPGDPGYISWIAGGPLTINLPIPPISGATQAFVMPGASIAGPSQVLLWDPPTSGGGTGGSQGVWRAAPLSSIQIAPESGLISGSGTANSITKWINDTTAGNSSISEDAGSVTFSGYGAGVLHTDVHGAITSTPVSLASDVSGTLPASNGGTGISTYTAGDILYADSTGSLSPLSAGVSGQVLGMSGGVPAWIANVTTTTNSNTPSTPAPISDNADNYTVDAAASYIRLSNSSGGPLDITGINSTGVSDGHTITLVNTSANVLIIKNQDSSSTSPNQFDLPGGADILVAQKGAVTLTYDATLHYWELVSTN